MDPSIVENINIFLVFCEGVISFFSPCILPLIPLYIGYLTQNCKSTNAEGKIEYNQVKVFMYTLCFVLGITTTFFIASATSNIMGSFLSSHRSTIGMVGGIIIILVGCLQLGLFSKIQLTKEIRIPLKLTKMNFLMAYVLGFCFSFAWTPCIGPMLASVMLLASSASGMMGNILIGVYALGFLIPFLLLGLFTSTILSLLKKYQYIVNYTIKIGGICLIILGLFMSISASKIVDGAGVSTKSKLDEKFDFTLVDQYNESHTISQNKGETIVLAFIASWCPYCNDYLQNLEELYLEKNENVKVIGVMSPNNGDEISKEQLLIYIKDNNITFPIVFDNDGKVFSTYQVNSLPITFIVKPNGEFLGYLKGFLEIDYLHQAISDAQKELGNA